MLPAHVPFAFASRVFDELLLTPPASDFAPAVDVTATDEAICFRVDVPGFRSEDLDVRVDHGVLTIAGQRRRALPDGERLVTGGRGYGRFERRWSVRDAVNPTELEATLDAGVLTLKIPFAAQARPRKVPIRAANERASATP